MTKKEYRALTEKYNMNMLTEEITGQNWGYYLDSDHYIDELDELAGKIDCQPVVCERLKLGGIIRQAKEYHKEEKRRQKLRQDQTWAQIKRVGPKPKEVICK